MLPIWIWIYFSNNQPQSVQGKKPKCKCLIFCEDSHQITSIDFSKNPRQKLQIGYPKHRRSSWPGKLWSFIRTPVCSLMTWVLDLVNMQRIHWDVYQPESYVDCGWRNKTLTLTTTCNGIRRNRCAECSPVSRMFDSNFLGKVNFSAKSEVADMLSISTLMASDSSGVVSHLQSPCRSILGEVYHCNIDKLNQETQQVQFNKAGNKLFWSQPSTSCWEAHAVDRGNNPSSLWPRVKPCGLGFGIYCSVVVRCHEIRNPQLQRSFTQHK